MIDNPFYTPEFHGEYDVIGIGALDLEEGGNIPDCRLAVATFGELNEARDNAIMIPTWFSGTHQIWREVYIGDGHSDRCAAEFADRTFATKGLAAWLEERGRHFERFEDFHSIVRALDRAAA